ncbi:transposable element Tcb2 transposase [Trichonephila clavipes]|uniref:Transposable element Tcb2 transposase n=1 Tax=Trichonephila clavipes TaxID=2585209 RepID=A0A8X6WB38_TRICX|nr:transposable element Tcb2 transposase [Trichonephila clavipes]
MSQRSHLTYSEAWRVVGRLEGGQTQAEVAQAIGVPQSVISRIWNRFLETGSAGRRPGQGRRRATTPNEDRYLVLTARRHRNMNDTLLQQHLRSATGTTVSTQTVRNGLHGVSLYGRRLISRFSVHPDNRRVFIWRERGSRNNPAFVHESVRFGGGGVLVYGGISIDGRTDLYIIRDGPLTARRYRDEILRPIVAPYAEAIGDDFILMDDNCRPQRANLVEDFLFEEGIVRIEWPACSPDMNPIEHVWDALGRQVSGRQTPSQNLQELERALLEEWDRIPQLMINSLINSMPQRCSTLLAVRGNHTPYLPVRDEIRNLIEKVVGFAREINLEVDSDDLQELLDSHYQELTIDELKEMHEQHIEELEFLDPVQSEDRMTIGI